MKKILLFITVLMLNALLVYSQPKSPSSANGKYVKVFTDNGYYVKAQNLSSSPCKFSFKYETVGYKVSSAAWAKYPVYTEVSSITDDYKNVTIEALEERNLFTAPVDPNKKIEYYIRIIDVYGEEQIQK
jgi:hypothetical protein